MRHIRRRLTFLPRRGFIWLALLAAAVAGIRLYSNALIANAQAYQDAWAAQRERVEALAQPAWDLQEQCAQMAGTSASPGDVEKALNLKLTPVAPGIGADPTRRCYQFAEPGTGAMIWLTFGNTGLIDAQIISWGNVTWSPPPRPASLSQAEPRLVVICALLGFGTLIALLMARLDTQRRVAAEAALLLTLCWLALAFWISSDMQSPDVRWLLSSSPSFKPGELLRAAGLLGLLALPVCLLAVAEAWRSPRRHLTASGVAAPAPLPTDSAPDWSTMPHEVHCPLCNYNLKGLPEPRCPECGYAFAWREVVEAGNPWSSNLFEHARHPFRAFLRTAMATLRPGRFFRQFPASDPPDPLRLASYALLIVACAFLPMLALDAAHLVRPFPGPGVGDSLVRIINNLIWPIDRWISESSSFRSTFHWVSDRNAGWAFGVFGLAWAGMSLVMMLTIPQTLAKAGVRRIHAVRCVVYSADVLVWIVPLSPLLFLLGLGSDHRALRLLVAILAIGAGLIMSWRQFQAARHYLRIPSAPLVVATLQIAVVLVGMAVATWLSL